ncbi:hypothetical protein TEA_023690 [Camellia sinensis var. sinensis]|uniref:Glutamate receptor n=1 Tax=Camellia sinensis var. sinensis TaxID=542762 RepID=A0A4S4E7G5_CAMSN|nr:hypothetical protein TEA_023690 [Camellia sinensis var. sinensis]
MASSSKPIITLVFIPILVSFFGTISHGAVVETDNITTTNVGVIIDVNSRIGKEQMTAMKIAVDNFNNKLSLYFRSPGLQAAYAADQLIKEKQVQVIIGMETWAETALVAKIGNQAQVPVISLAAAIGTTKTTQWPFLIQMVTNFSNQMDCTAALVHSFKWRRVIVVYEENKFSGDSNMLAILSDALHNVGSVIEHHLVIPPFQSLSHPLEFVREELMKLNNIQPRAFIVLQSSLQFTSLLFSEARKMGFMGKDSAWVITDTIASFLDSVNSSFISSMEGVFGIKMDYSENTTSFLDFKKQFQQSFRFEYPEEENSNPGIYALRAYDSIATVIVALERLTHSTSSSTSTRLLDTILSSNFSGLSGEIHFEDERLPYTPIYRVIKVCNLTYKKLEYWSPEFGFLKSLDAAKSGKNGSIGKDDWRRSLGNPKPVPCLEDPLVIGVPGRATFDAFVKKMASTKNSNEAYDGFCIRVFKEVLKILGYDLPYKFVEFNGTYGDLVKNVANKTFDGAVGDITILAERWTGVEFTQPITESGLSLVVPVKPASKAWIFLEPFTMEMWLATGAILIYTMFIVWFLEHRSNPEFSGPWKDQLGNVLWFTFSSLFLVHMAVICWDCFSLEQASLVCFLSRGLYFYSKALDWVWKVYALVSGLHIALVLHWGEVWDLKWSAARPAAVMVYVGGLLQYYSGSLSAERSLSWWIVFGEKIQSNYTRVVVVVWLFVVLILTQSFTASLTSMLTVSRLQPNINPMNKVGCDANAFMSTYVQDVLKYKSENVKLIRDQDEYLMAFKNGSISAAFLEIPYAKVFTNNYCMKYTVIGSTYRFGGFGFVFQEGSRIADDVSKAILQLSENGSLKRLEEEWLTPSSECLDSQNTKNVDSLGLESFWGLFLFSIVTSSICFIIFVAHLLRNYRHHQSRIGDIHGSDESVWNKTRKLARYLSDAEIKSQRKDPTTGQEVTGN